MEEEAVRRTLPFAISGNLIPGTELLLDVKHESHLKRGKDSDLV